MNSKDTWAEAKKATKTKWGKYVSDFLIQEFKFGVPVWEQKDPVELKLPKEEEKRFRELLLSRIIRINNEDDQIVWCGTKSNNYVVKIGYKLLDQEYLNIQCPHHLLWNKDCLQKASAFSWLAIRDRILTGD